MKTVEKKACASTKLPVQSLFQKPQGETDYCHGVGGVGGFRHHCGYWGLRDGNVSVVEGFASWVGMPTLPALGLDRDEDGATKTLIGDSNTMTVSCAMHGRSQPESGREKAQKKDEKTWLGVQQSKRWRARSFFGIFRCRNEVCCRVELEKKMRTATTTVPPVQQHGVKKEATCPRRTRIRITLEHPNSIIVYNCRNSF
jgi:hypothetical protein